MPSACDRAILEHVKGLAKICNGSRVVLLHVADGWVARPLRARSGQPGNQ